MFEEHERQESLRTVSPAALPLPARAAHASPPERPPRPPVLYSEVSRDRQVLPFFFKFSHAKTWFQYRLLSKNKKYI